MEKRKRQQKKRKKQKQTTHKHNTNKTFLGEGGAGEGPVQSPFFLALSWCLLVLWEPPWVNEKTPREGTNAGFLGVSTPSPGQGTPDPNTPEQRRQARQRVRVVWLRWATASSICWPATWAVSSSTVPCRSSSMASWRWGRRQVTIFWM